MFAGHVDLPEAGPARVRTVFNLHATDLLLAIVFDGVQVGVRNRLGLIPFARGPFFAIRTENLRQRIEMPVAAREVSPCEEDQNHDQHRTTPSEPSAASNANSASGHCADVAFVWLLYKVAAGVHQGVLVLEVYNVFILVGPDGVVSCPGRSADCPRVVVEALQLPDVVDRKLKLHRDPGRSDRVPVPVADLHREALHGDLGVPCPGHHVHRGESELA
mmetsp:Transcript_3083/g.9373  ORF Transcript_3083/g.9373 Transcript_3083/m.9373 type:complete len:218 (+) Transcript_3083:348-1001(+)